MAVRGKRPTPPALRLVKAGQGHPPAGSAKAATLPPIEKPDGLSDGAALIWDRVISKAKWLTLFDGQAARMWVELSAQFIADPTAMSAARISQIRHLASELGLDPVSRMRLGDLVLTDDQDADDPAALYFARTRAGAHPSNPVRK